MKQTSFSSSNLCPRSVISYCCCSFSFFFQKSKSSALSADVHPTPGTLFFKAASSTDSSASQPHCHIPADHPIHCLILPSQHACQVGTALKPSKYELHISSLSALIISCDFIDPPKKYFGSLKLTSNLQTQI